MGDLRSELGLARVMTPEAPYPHEPNAIEAKFRIAELLDLPINCVDRFAERTGLARPAASLTETGMSGALGGANQR
jgi:hypothetical protein